MNKEKFDLLGITKFHEAGFVGQGITVVSIENGKTKHSQKVEDILRQVLPKANIISSIKYWADEINTIHLDGYTCSQTRADSTDAEKIEKAKELYGRNVFMTCSIGNEYDLEYSKLAEHDEWVSVGACQYTHGKIQLEGYSSRSEFLDFVSITNMDTTNLGKFSGTSCATPVLQGMAMLVQEFFKKNTGRKLTNEELFKFIKDNSVDLEENGHDKNTGHGLFVLPDPASIDIEKYVGENMKKKIVLKIDSKVAIVDGEERILDASPIILNNRTMLPIRFIAEELGFKVLWNEATREVIIEK